jgi:hypothetical protein
MALRRALAVLVLAAPLTSTLFAGPAAAQDDSVRIEGRVLWIAAQTMVVAPYEDSIPVRVDLSRVAQDEYMRLGADDAVAVTGTVSYDRDRIIATSIQSR